MNSPELTFKKINMELNKIQDDVTNAINCDKKISVEKIEEYNLLIDAKWLQHKTMNTGV